MRMNHRESQGVQGEADAPDCAETCLMGAFERMSTAGSKVNAKAKAIKTPAAVYRPNSRMGPMAEDNKVRKPSAV